MFLTVSELSPTPTPMSCLSQGLRKPKVVRSARSRHLVDPLFLLGRTLDSYRDLLFVTEVYKLSLAAGSARYIFWCMVIQTEHVCECVCVCSGCMCCERP